ncbi:hypothetical protein [Bradyrhizobium sp.]|uniref:hypothetical protein n=1 Tax=Bradyrhizobium sp. TaxID=376 RepID=UPI003C6B73FF
MRDKRFFQEGFLSDSPHVRPSAPALPMGDDAALLALDAQFHSFAAELVAAQSARHVPANSPAGRPASRSHVQTRIESEMDQEDQSERTEAILARLYPIEQAIMTTPARTIKGLGVKARHVAYVMSHCWEKPIEQIDWDARAMRLLIEAVCGLADVPLPGCEAANNVSP